MDSSRRTRKAVYGEIMARLMEMREGKDEKQSRIQPEFCALVQGNMDALQYEGAFEKLADGL